MRSARRSMLARLLLALAAAIAGVTSVAPVAPAGATDGPLLDAPALPRRAGGYWFVAADGGVFAFGGAVFHGSTGSAPLDAPVVAMAATPSGAGYWLAGADGDVHAFGDAPLLGSMRGTPLSQAIVAMIATPTGRGYWLVARDGGIFAFGDAAYAGSTGAMHLNQPIVGAAATPTGRGYWLAAADGGVFAFGDAAFHGSTGAIRLNAPMVGMASTPSGRGYWMVANDGGIFAFGDALFLGSTGGTRLNRPIVSMASTGLGNGYWLVAADGGVFSFGDAAFHGSAGHVPLNSPIVGSAAPLLPRGVGAAVFYYPWYDAPDDGGDWRHWDDPNPDAAQPAFTPPSSIAANFYPARGLYSSRSRVIADQHMADIARAGIGTVVISWWGRGSYEDDALASVVAAARAAGVTPAVHLEPYPGRTPESSALDVEYLTAARGVGEVWIYLSDGHPARSWRTLTDSFPTVRFWAHTHRPENAMSGLFPAYAVEAGFDGVYTYDPLPYDPDSFARVCMRARVRGLLCSPSVNPGYDDRRIRPDAGTVRSRGDGARYDELWRGAVRAGPDLVSITSYNEWHEGTQLEAAAPSDYDGAYGRTGAAASDAYLHRTADWTAALSI